VRVVGYVRDAAGPAEVEPAFAQAERIRKWVHESGHQLVAVCQDVRTPGRDLGRDGYRALLGIVSSGEAEAVVVPDLTILSPDKIMQEVMLWHLRARGAAVLSTAADDLAVLSDPPDEQIRIIVRDVLARVSSHDELVSLPAPAPVDDTEQAPLPESVAAPTDANDAADADGDVIIELITPATDRPQRLRG
jgi:hypothetical protein